MTAKSKIDYPELPSTGAPDLVEEDGWLFRERPGIPIECVGRVAEVVRGEPRPLYHSRQNYPNT